MERAGNLDSMGSHTSMLLQYICSFMYNNLFKTLEYFTQSFHKLDMTAKYQVSFYSHFTGTSICSDLFVNCHVTSAEKPCTAIQQLVERTGGITCTYAKSKRKKASK